MESEQLWRRAAITRRNVSDAEDLAAGHRAVQCVRNTRQKISFLRHFDVFMTDASVEWLTDYFTY